MKRFVFVFAALLISTFGTLTFAQNDVEGLLKKSEEYNRQNKLDEAVGELTKAITIQPANADLYLRRANFYLFLDDSESLVANVNKAVGLNPSDKNVILNAAHLLRRVQRCAESLNVLNNYILQNAESDDAIFSRSQSNMCLGDWVSAYQDVSRASELKPNNNNYRTVQASLLARLGDSANSAEQFGQMIKALETKLTKTTNKGLKGSLQNDLARAYHARAGVSRAKGDTASEFADLAKFIEYLPDAYSYRVRGKVYQDHQMYAEAIADYSEAIKRTPTEPIFWLERGDIFAEAKKYQEALKDYEQSLKLDPTLKEIVQQRIEHLNTQSKNDK